MKKLLMICCTIALAGCIATGQTIPKANGQYLAIGKGASKTAARDVVLKTASKTCKNQNKRHVMGNDEVTTYKGIVSEDTNRNVNAVLDIAAYAGVYAPGLSSKEDYEMTMEFTCV